MLGLPHPRVCRKGSSHSSWCDPWQQSVQHPAATVQSYVRDPYWFRWKSIRSIYWRWHRLRLDLKTHSQSSSSVCKASSPIFIYGPWTALKPRARPFFSITRTPAHIPTVLVAWFYEATIILFRTYLVIYIIILSVQYCILMFQQRKISCPYSPSLICDSLKCPKRHSSSYTLSQPPIHPRGCTSHMPWDSDSPWRPWFKMAMHDVRTAVIHLTWFISYTPWSSTCSSVMFFLGIKPMPLRPMTPRHRPLTKIPPPGKKTWRSLSETKGSLTTGQWVEKAGSTTPPNPNFSKLP